MAQIRAFAIIGASLWNQLLPSTRTTLLSGEPNASFVLSRLLSSFWVPRTGRASDWCALQEALYKCIDTIQYNTLSMNTRSSTVAKYSTIIMSVIREVRVKAAKRKTSEVKGSIKTL